MAAFFEQLFRMGLLEKAGADLARRNMRGDREHGHARAVAVEETINEMQIARPAAAGADREFTSQMRLRPCREGRDLLVPDMDPLDLALAAKRVRQPVQAIANNAINPLDASRSQDVCELIGYGTGHILTSDEVAEIAFPPFAAKPEVTGLSGACRHQQMQCGIRTKVPKPALWGEDKEREAVPGASDAERLLPDTWREGRCPEGKQE
jgi:hypothetical protein